MAGDKLNINLLDRRYSVRCTAEQQAGLQKAADYLASKLLEIRRVHKNLTREEAVMMAALNISYDYLHTSQADGGKDKVQQTVAALNKKIKDFLTQ